MSRRVSLPGADELFRATSHTAAAAATTSAAVAGAAEPAGRDVSVPPAPARALEPVPDPPAGASGGPGSAAGTRPATAVRQTSRRRAVSSPPRPSGRERHDEKITVYLSADELFDLERARLALRGEHGLAVDRGRIVREAVSLVVAELEAKGEASILVRRLREG